ncbi:electron transfer flavoprotein subunit beta/FixA family protein [Vulcanisaeta souniana]|uniref:Electron transfer flavoprotein subunit beta n=1 Tax=Vulcanisaeta souniana JCM 11219 TaxID=1293586 RepID=A0A830E719_9CREN|nr:electron transfer flavoprotein subunit beta/FixA family protein [Vulcanisaeta souniana]BDR93146.1 electron transfer flavoprotein subunit beta [Vulcanisaeta souniana JCM 11219]GGI78013.1 electron transfer flavoprotein subunit beta [Vulcanisaeta souniana JCM 11219]
MASLRNIIVTMKVTPKPEEIRFDPTTKTVDRSKATNEINPADKNALELALQLKEKYGGRVVILSMGPPFWDQFLKMGIAMGADDAVLISDRALGGSDAFVTSRVLAAAVKKIGDYSLVIAGEESEDGSTGQVPPGMAEWLGIPAVTYVSQVTDAMEDSIIVKRTIKGGYETVKVKLPAVISVELGINTPRFPDFERLQWAQNEFKTTIWGIKDLGIAENEVGFKGSLTAVTELRELRPRERLRQFIEGSPEEIARELIKRLGLK